MGSQGDEVLINKLRNLLIGIGLGFQPSTCASGGRGRKIDEQRFVLGFRVGESGVDVFEPINEHVFPSFRTESTADLS